MSKVLMFDLSEMPLYSAQIRQVENNSQADISDELAKWVSQRNKTGKIGENIAYQYLQAKFKSVHPPLNDSYGYDIQVDDQYFEVKTSTSKRRDFFITINELKTADKHTGNYQIFYIMLDKVKSEAIGYIIRNPLEIFGITLSELFQTTQKGNVFFDAVVYKIQLGNLLDTIEKIDLSDILRKIEINKKHSKN